MSREVTYLDVADDQLTEIFGEIDAPRFKDALTQMLSDHPNLDEFTYIHGGPRYTHRTYKTKSTDVFPSVIILFSESGDAITIMDVTEEIP